MKKIHLLALCSLLFLLSSCLAIGAIFKAGVWVGALIVLAVVGLILYLVMRGSNKS
jgi:hypothetical protein